MKRERLFYLDFIRALSVIFIIIFHFNCHLRFERVITKGIFPIISEHYFSTVGVSLFIIISGAALMYTYQDKLIMKDFVVKRFFSIYPIFWTAYVLAFLYKFYINRVITGVPKWRFIFTVFGVDGYLSIHNIPNFYIVGEWFLGFIILFYLIFPFLRKYTIKKPKILAIATCITYVIVLGLFANGFKIDLYTNILGRLPEFLFGMYFVYYIKNVNVYLFIGALCIIMLNISDTLIINTMLKITVMGMSAFIVLAYIGQHMRIQKIKGIFCFVSKYSFAGILGNQLLMWAVMKHFTGYKVTRLGSYCLFIIVCIVITIVAVNLNKISNKFSRYLKEILSFIDLNKKTNQETNQTTTE